MKSGQAVVCSPASLLLLLVQFCPSQAVQVTGKTQCPPNIGTDVTKLHNGKCYQFVVTERTWVNARRACHSKGGYLVEIPDSAVHDYLVASLHSLRWPFRGVWIGATDQDAEGIWMWDTGANVTYANWAPGQEGNGTHGFLFGHGELPPNMLEDCAQIRLTDPQGRWHDYPCNGRFYKYSSICQFESVPVTTSTAAATTAEIRRPRTPPTTTTSTTTTTTTTPQPNTTIRRTNTTPCATPTTRKTTKPATTTTTTTKPTSTTSIRTQKSNTASTPTKTTIPTTTTTPPKLTTITTPQPTTTTTTTPTTVIAAVISRKVAAAKPTSRQTTGTKRFTITSTTTTTTPTPTTTTTTTTTTTNPTTTTTTPTTTTSVPSTSTPPTPSTAHKKPTQKPVTSTTTTTTTTTSTSASSPTPSPKLDTSPASTLGASQSSNSPGSKMTTVDTVIIGSRPPASTSRVKQTTSTTAKPNANSATGGLVSGTGTSARTRSPSAATAPVTQSAVAEMTSTQKQVGETHAPLTGGNGKRGGSSSSSKTGMLVGIIVGSVLGVALTGFLIVIVWKGRSTVHKAFLSDQDVAFENMGYGTGVYFERDDQQIITCKHDFGESKS